MLHVVDPPEPLALDSLPSMPAAALTIVRLCDNPDVGLDELSAAVAMDPVLSARILRMANSAAYSRGTEITSLDLAMMLMGTKVVKITALGFSLSSIVTDHLSGGSDIGTQVWRQCLVKAIACRELAGLAGLRAAPEAFLAGLFDGMGQMLAYITRPAQYEALIGTDPWPDAEAEQAGLGFTVAHLAQSALRSWGVPELYVDVLEQSEQEIDLTEDGDPSRLAAVLVLARHAAKLMLGGPNDDEERATRATSKLGLDQDAVDTIAVTLGVHVKDLATTLDVDLGGDVDYQAVLNQARTQIIETSMQMAQESLRQTEQIHSLEGEHEALRLEAMTDRLTGLPNRASFDERLSNAVRRRIGRASTSGSLGIAMIDIDRFKVLNDTYGHRAGDAVLAAVGQALRAVTRRGEVVARYGGEEFVLVTEGIADTDALLIVAERIRRAIEDLRIESDGHTLVATVSIGAVCSNEIMSVRAGAELVEAADRLLYVSKRGGRNTVRVSELSRAHTVVA